MHVKKVIVQYVNIFKNPLRKTRKINNYNTQMSELIAFCSFFVYSKINLNNFTSEIFLYEVISPFVENRWLNILVL